MGKPEFDLRIKVKPSSRLKRKPETKAVDAVYRKDIKAKKSIKKKSKTVQRKQQTRTTCIENRNVSPY